MGKASKTAGHLWGKGSNRVESEDRLDQAIEIAYGFVTEATAMSSRLGVSIETTIALLTRAESTLDRMIERGANTAKLRYRKALMLLERRE